MPVNEALKSRIIDEKDSEILMILQQNSRETLTNIAKKVRLSIDSVNNRIKVMQSKNIVDFTTSINPRAIGFMLVADIKIKLKDASADNKEQFINYLKGHPRVTDLLGIMGDYDFTCVIIAKNTDDLDEVSNQIREKYNKIIADWKGILVTKTYKFDTYDLTA